MTSRDCPETSKETYVPPAWAIGYPSPLRRSLCSRRIRQLVALPTIFQLTQEAQHMQSRRQLAHSQRELLRVEKCDKRNQSCSRNRLMAATETLEKEVDERCEVGREEFPRREELAPVFESCASHVEVWINEEFGDDDDVDTSRTMHDEADSYATLRQQVEEYIEVEDLRHSAMDSMFNDDVDSDSEDSQESEMGYEPQLWSFTV